MEDSYKYLHVYSYSIDWDAISVDTRDKSIKGWKGRVFLVKASDARDVP